MQIIRLSSATIIFREGVLIIEQAGKNSIDVAEAKKQIKAAHKITQDQSCPLIFIDHSGGEISTEAIEMFSREVRNGKITTQAFVFSSLPKRLKANFYSRLHQENKSKVFASFNQAWKWTFENRG